MTKNKRGPRTEGGLERRAREYCKGIGADEVYNVALLGDGDYRIMYFIKEDGVRKMNAVVLRVPAD